jgi:thiopeptide-type bacteriocin biosynthesis protein
VASFGDHRIPLDLDDPLHLRVLRQEAVRRPELFLQEIPGGEDYPDGWLAGADGPHRCELVFPLLRRVTPVSRPAQVPVYAPARGANRDLFQPGGEWVFAKLYTSPTRQIELLRDYLPGILSSLLAAGGVDRWFFIRYHDPEPHLRLRFHGLPDQLWGGLMPALNVWMGQLREAALANRLVVDAYDPELERYGGPEVIADAERVFEADSVASLALLQVLDAAGAALEPVLLAAASLVDLMCGFYAACRTEGEPQGPGHSHWLEIAGGKADQREAFASRRQAALLLIDPEDEWRGLLSQPYGKAVERAWEKRRPEVAAYGRSVQSLVAAGRCWTPVERIAVSLMHMHCNRLLGTSHDAEGQALAIARGAMRVHRDRARFAS